MIDETLSPTWDELLIIDNVILYGTKDEIKNHPPTIVVEIFDQDKVVIERVHAGKRILIAYLWQGKSEFIGRTVAKPHVKLLEDDYVKPEFPPSLEWYDVHRGMEHAGELLATFELLQVGLCFVMESSNRYALTRRVYVVFFLFYSFLMH